MTRTPRLLPLVLLATACAVAPAPAPAPAPAAPPVATAVPLQPDEEAVVLRLEDLREFDADLAAAWIADPNPARRRRIAIALGRIGTAAFADANRNGVKDEGEMMAGVALLSSLVDDPSHEVREAAAFALGEIGDPAGIDALFDLARDREHAGVAAAAIEALSKLAGDVPFDRYAAFAAEPHPEGVRARALQYLFRFEDDAAAMLAATYLADPSATIRREAAYSLARRATPAARDRLHLLLTDPDTLTRAYAARALGRIADASSVEPLLAALDDVHPWVRTNALVALGQLAAKHPGILGQAPADQSGWIVTLTRDADPGTAISAIEPLGFLATDSPAARIRLLELAADGTPWQREVATAAFLKHFAASDPAAVESLLTTDSRFLEIRALEVTPDIGETGASIRARFLNDPDAAVRAAALSAIPDEAVGALREEIEAALADPDPIVRATAIGRWAAIPDIPPAEKLDRLGDELARAEGDELNDARLAALSAIAELDVPERFGVLEPLVSDADPVVRRAAAEAIAAGGRPLPAFAPLPVDRPLEEYEEIARWALGSHVATLRTTRGDIEIALVTRDAPLTSWNFVQLAEDGYFDGTTFMRVVPNFVIQGGDPRNDQSGGPGYAIRDEINMQRYTRGAVGMALSGPDTGGSQYFVTHSPQPHLDGGYTIFGRVIGGMSGVVDQIQRGDTVTDVVIDGRVVDDAAERAATAEEPPLPTETGMFTAERLLLRVPEYPERKEAYEPNAAAMEMIAATVRPGDTLEVVLGTWCTDSQREVPKLLKILDILQEDFAVELPVSYLAVDRSKQDPAGGTEGKKIEYVPTFIYYRDGREIGRIVEKPEGLFEDHLFRITAQP
ncbi:MAG: HEAT repeat domain-containing protein [Thermoanaerobaculia bacterium]